jgi:rhodanese-related sulfurtransferase
MSLIDTLKHVFARPYATVGPQEAVDLLGRGGLLLDVREPHEWQAGHAPKARHIPLGHLTRRRPELPAGRPILVVCRSGNRSRRAAALLARDGRQVANLAGGMRAWARAGLPLVAKGGGPGSVA